MKQVPGLVSPSGGWQSCVVHERAGAAPMMAPARLVVCRPRPLAGTFVQLTSYTPRPGGVSRWPRSP